ncbi:MAG: SDR family oxidoreductase [Gordonia sp. (in: high G+C Gram-positive bacteria)]
MPSYFITGSSGFIGRRVLAGLLAADGTATVHALVRESSLTRFTELLTALPGGERVQVVLGDLTAPRLGLAPEVDEALHVDHVVHLGAIYDMAADAESQHQANVLGTDRVADFAVRHDALCHHISSIAVAGDHRGPFTEADFDLGQQFPTPYHRTKFEAESIVRHRVGLRWRVYRPSVVVGDSRTGEMDKIDGPYHFFGRLGQLGALPSAVPIPFPNLGRINLVPVDYVVEALLALIPLEPDVSGRVFHLGDPAATSVTDMYNALAPAFGGPQAYTAVPHALVAPAMFLAGRAPLRIGRDLLATQEGVPPALLDATALPVDFRSDQTVDLLAPLGVQPRGLRDYGPRLWRYWYDHLDPARHRRTDPRGPLVGKVVLITGGSAGIGKATARKCVARGATTVIVARNAGDLDNATAELNEITPKPGLPAGRAYSYVCDVTDSESVLTTVKTVLAEHDHIDVLVNNAGRSIRRATINAVDRSHDYHRVMAVNYFGAVNMILAVLPHWTERRSGHVVNVTSIEVQARAGRFGAYAASKAALEAFTDTLAVETLSEHLTFTNVRLPLVRTRMITPTDSYREAMRVWNVDKAAAHVLDAILRRPPRISTPLGNLAALGRFFAPRLTTRVLHQGYLLSSESAAALGRARVDVGKSE